MDLQQVRAAVLQYLVGDEDVFCVLISDQNEFETYKLARYADVFPLIDELDAELRRAPISAHDSPRTLQDFSINWGRTLLPPIQSLESYEVLVVVPHHSLHSIPTHAIWIPECQTFLGHRFAIAYCPSPTQFVRCTYRNRARMHKRHWTFGLGEDGGVDAPDPPDTCFSVGCDALTGHDDLYRSAASSFAAHFRTSDVCRLVDRPIVKQMINGGRFPVLCFVCHSYFDPEFPWYSGLVLTTSPGLEMQEPVLLDQGLALFYRHLPFRLFPGRVAAAGDEIREIEILTVAELNAAGPITAELVALLSCSSARGGARSVDPHFSSMGAQMLALGAASVLAATWPVNIQFAEALANAFLTNWVRYRQPKAIAWRETIKDASRLLGPAADNPHNWGGLILMGDWL